MSDYRLRISHVSGHAVHLRPGSQEERDLVDTVTAKAVAQGIGLFRTEATVKAAIAHAVHETFWEAKADVIPR